MITDRARFWSAVAGACTVGLAFGVCVGAGITVRHAATFVPTVNETTLECGAVGETWAVWWHARDDGFCHIEDLPGWAPHPIPPRPSP